MAITRPTPVELSKGTAKTMGRTWTDSSESDVSPVIGFVDGHFQQGKFGTDGEY